MKTNIKKLIFGAVAVTTVTAIVFTSALAAEGNKITEKGEKGIGFFGMHKGFRGGFHPNGGWGFGKGHKMMGKELTEEEKAEMQAKMEEKKAEMEAKKAEMEAEREAKMAEKEAEREAKLKEKLAKGEITQEQYDEMITKKFVKNGFFSEKKELTEEEKAEIQVKMEEKKAEMEAKKAEMEAEREAKMAEKEAEREAKLKEKLANGEITQDEYDEMIAKKPGKRFGMGFGRGMKRGFGRGPVSKSDEAVVEE